MAPPPGRRSEPRAAPAQPSEAQAGQQRGPAGCARPLLLSVGCVSGSASSQKAVSFLLSKHSGWPAPGLQFAKPLSETWGLATFTVVRLPDDFPGPARCQALGRLQVGGGRGRGLFWGRGGFAGRCCSVGGILHCLCVCVPSTCVGHTGTLFPLSWCVRGGAGGGLRLPVGVTREARGGRPVGRKPREGECSPRAGLGRVLGRVLRPQVPRGVARTGWDSLDQI